MKIDITILSPKGEFNFSCFAHLTPNADNRMIKKEFYEKWCPNAIPQGDHHELELLSPIPNLLSNPFVHIYINPDTKKEFVCWTGSLPTIRSVEIMFKMWCAGTVYTLTHDKDFVPLFNGGYEAFMSLMKDEYGISVKEISHSN